MSTDQQPSPKKQKVEENAKSNVADESSEHLGPWAVRWNNKQIGFHLADVNEVIKSHVEKLLPSTDTDDEGETKKKTTCSNRRVFVPLCGKTVDMPFLVQIADEVVGVEGIRLALEQFAEEHPDLKVVAQGTVHGGFERFQGEKITLLRGDYFDLNDIQAGGKFGAIYDRASMVAIEPELRQKYVEVLEKLVAPGGKILLVVLERQGEEEAMKKGPPYSIPDSTVRELFEGQDWVETITLLEESDQLERNPEDRKRYEGLDKLLEKVYLIQAK